MKKQTLEARIQRLEAIIKPRSKDKPLVVFIRPVGYGGMTRQGFAAAMKALSPGQAAMILPRPEDPFDKTAAERHAEASLKEAGSRALVIELVHVRHAGEPSEDAQPLTLAGRPVEDMTDAEVEDELARLEAKVKPKRGKK
jgi:hypothetical protein